MQRDNWESADRVLPKVLAAAKASWVTKTTRDNLVLMKQARARTGLSLPQLEQLIGHLERRTSELA